MTKRDACSDCGRKGRVLGHHDDYAKPLEIRWLCRSCHMRWHAANGEGQNRHLSGIADAVIATHENYTEMAELIRAGWTLREVGKKFGVSHEWVRKIVGSPRNFRPLKRDVAATQIETITALREQGKTLAEIGRKLNVSAPVLAHMGLPKRVLVPEHGTPKEYQRGCRCRICVKANSARHLQYMRKIRSA